MKHCELISSKNFPCSLVEKVCVSDSVTQKYGSLLSCENPMALQCNLAVLRKWGWRAGTEKMWINTRRLTMNKVCSGLIFLEVSQSLKSLTITGNIWNKFCHIVALVYLIHYFPFAWIWCAALGYNTYSTWKGRRGNSPPDTDGIYFQLECQVNQHQGSEVVSGLKYSVFCFVCAESFYRTTCIVFLCY